MPTRRTWLRVAILCLGGAAVAGAVNAVRPDVDGQGRPRRLAWRTPAPVALAEADVVTPREAEQLWTTGDAFFLDARAPADYAAGHIALAHNLPAETFAQHYPHVSGILTKDAVLVVYCDGRQCELSQELAEKLRRLGYVHVRVLENGWTVWRTAGLPTKSGEQP